MLMNTTTSRIMLSRTETVVRFLNLLLLSCKFQHLSWFRRKNLMVSIIQTVTLYMFFFLFYEIFMIACKENWKLYCAVGSLTSNTWSLNWIIFRETAQQTRDSSPHQQTQPRGTREEDRDQAEERWEKPAEQERPEEEEDYNVINHCSQDSLVYHQTSFILCLLVCCHDKPFNNQ